MNKFLSRSANNNALYCAAFLPANQDENRSKYCSDPQYLLKRSRRVLFNMLLRTETEVERLRARRHSMRSALKDASKEAKRRLSTPLPPFPSAIELASDDEDDEVEDLVEKTDGLALTDDSFNEFLEKFSREGARGEVSGSSKDYLAW
jgi:molecular chaperone GrpE (heat shock protein)